MSGSENQSPRGSCPATCWTSSGTFAVCLTHEITPTTYPILDFLTWQRQDLLDLRPPFQRLSVWTKRSKACLSIASFVGIHTPHLSAEHAGSGQSCLSDRSSMANSGSGLFFPLLILHVWRIALRRMSLRFFGPTTPTTTDFLLWNYRKMSELRSSRRNFRRLCFRRRIADVEVLRYSDALINGTET